MFIVLLVIIIIDSIVFENLCEKNIMNITFKTEDQVFNTTKQNFYILAII